MNFSTPFGRITAVVAGMFIGLIGALAFIAPASAHTAGLTGTSSCAGDSGGWTVTWKLTTTDTHGSDGVFSNVKPAVTTPQKPPGGPWNGPPLKTFVENGKVTGDGDFTEVQTFGPGDTAMALAFTVTWHDGTGTHTKNVWADAEAPTGCTHPNPTPTPTTPPTIPPIGSSTTPTPILKEDCTTITIGVQNPPAGDTVTLRFKTSTGESRTTVVKAGETKTETFPAVPGFSVTVTPEGIPDATPETISYVRPDNCGTGGTGGADSDDGGLPITGAAAASIAGGAAVLLAAGAVLFVVSRRRKVKFTA